MFAVPGWSISSDKLKTQIERPKKEKRKEREKQQKRERKEQIRELKSARSANTTLHTDVYTGNCSTRTTGGEKRKAAAVDDGECKGRDASKKARKAPSDQSLHDEPLISKKSTQLSKDQRPGTGGHDRKEGSKKKKKSSSPHKIKDEASPPPANEQGQGSVDRTTTASSPATASAVTLTPLQTAMRAKLMGSRFRHLNESLYIKPSSESMQLFAQNPNFFNDYHTGFRQQVSSWPENPVNTFFKELQERNVVYTTQQGGRPLPRTKGLCRVADLGCGDAALAAKVKSLGKKSRIEVDSFDLHSKEHIVIKADIANLPVASDSVNIAIFCLALMGTNWIEFVEEAWRVLHWKGELWVAEIKSRFSRTQRKPPDHSIGKKRKPGKDETRKQKQQTEQQDAERTIAEMDGTAETREGTDVSAFVAVLKKRGFDPVEEDAMDLSNKMFVRMKFVKNRPPIKGKYEGQGAKKKDWREMLREGQDDGIDEAGILQPCLYKLR